MSQATRTSMDPVSLNDFRTQWGCAREAVLGAVERVGASGWLVLGAEVAAFEKELAAYWGMAHAVGCASGLDAIEIALRCAGLEPGDRVLTSPLSAFATTLAVERAGGVPLFVDVAPSGLLDLDLAEAALDSHRDVRFLLPVHLYGHAIDARRMARLRERFDLVIVEDCAQAIGASSYGVPVGATGGLAATSFYPTKNLGCMGDGGALLTGSAEHAALARSLRDYGQTCKYQHQHLGLNSRLDELQAAILRDAFLPELARRTARRVQIAARYREAIENPLLELPPAPEGSRSVWHLFPVLVSEERAAFRAHLDRAAVATGIHYPLLIPDQEALAPYAGNHLLGSIPRARAFASREVSLPIHPFLDDGAVERVVDACNSWRP